MKRALRIATTLFCLLSLAAVPFFCGSAPAGAHTHCAGAMPGSPAMPCCAVHPVDHTEQAAVDFELPSPALVVLPLQPDSLITLKTPIRVAARQTSPPPGSFQPPLRI